MINIYTDSSLLIPENRGIVHPLIFDLHYFKQVHSDVLARYALVANPEMADVFLFPLDYLSIDLKGYREQYDNLHRQALDFHKKLMVYVGGDYGKTFNDDAIIVWRNAGFKTTNDTHTVIIPAFINDPLERDEIDYKLLAYTEKPQVSFTGFATNSRKESLRLFLATIKGNILRIVRKDGTDMQKVFNAARKRFKYLKQLENSGRIQTAFIYRNKYRAGATTKKDREYTATVFYANINNSPYIFCLRGAGNFSVRFYEGLACGRIPILVDTDSTLPLESYINWDAHICRVSVEDDLIETLLKFHKGHCESSFVQLQESNRALYQDYLVRDRFFCNLHPYLKQIL